ncbi:MBL fold metallo-hydrolase [Salidesulfovibrio onnuriiensis]|uniref:MBL fold metallo-hydrolase n=1 Tax=Salidesulfovibrio onnuriiensis TaxID=2583823 RepID=UPI0011C7DF0A|nr:MBL fold metallo-hydrolase [Salidesulfovibrio onnuriiensis]
MTNSAPIRISILMDNTAGPGLACEWGFSTSIRTGNELWIWDAGASPKFLANAALMGIDPLEAAGLALSHGHYDHTGGIQAFREAGYQGPVFAHPGCTRKRYSVKEAGTKSIGLASPLGDFTPVADTGKLNGVITMITDIPRIPGNYQAVKGFSFSPDENIPDPVEDDAFLAIDTPKGWVIQLGCCHSGVMNSLLCARERLGVEHIHAVLGGLHLYNADTAAIEESAEACRMFGVEKLAVGHCTGEKAAKALKEMLDCEVTDLRSGMRFDF